MEKIKRCKKCGWEFHSDNNKYKNTCYICQEKESKEKILIKKKILNPIELKNILIWR